MAVVAVCSLALVPASAAGQVGTIGTGGWIVCEEAATVQIEPGLTLFPQPARFNGADVISNCRSSDPTIKGGTAEIRAWSAAASCGLSVIDGIAEIEWDNEETSRILFSGVIAGGSAAARGTVVEGRFEGQPFAAADVPPGPDPNAPGACSGPPGLTSADIIGYISIGLPLVHGPLPG